MSVKVDLDQLADTLADYRLAYLITVGDDFRAHTVAVDPVLTAGVLDVGAMGRTTRANVTGHGDVTVIWPPGEPGGYTLILDGTARPNDDTLQVVPTRAVLHRKATPESPSTNPNCVHDCVPIEQA
ncbi:pyridoxamine 5'-phosphate oxidase family protein [Aldersonia sp. NBC_00410]|uniref:pyridoxamine 5'-phosphate oxidase family protein n=1 Tax=Aldersonia sp. NBC_00410 TaxID=2975954 RepID=UPI002251289B|nr:pyridoxamine 5'-phosphate oxidase family protein [Aldersonia sp. NBC_00410]MCX5046372.1 pyridoxamine 5'-phosphate oxidase family protein [Aldersonia sp. NBC_00410]